MMKGLEEKGYLYHATFGKYISSIKKAGLNPGINKNWDISSSSGICLCSDPEIAFSFCECAEDVSDEIYDSGIVVLAITRGLRKDLLIKDPNINPNPDADNVHYLLYKGVIPASSLYIVTRKSGLCSSLVEAQRVARYE